MDIYGEDGHCIVGLRYGEKPMSPTVWSHASRCKYQVGTNAHHLPSAMSAEISGSYAALYCMTMKTPSQANQVSRAHHERSSEPRYKRGSYKKVDYHEHQHASSDVLKMKTHHDNVLTWCFVCFGMSPESSRRLFSFSNSHCLWFGHEVPRRLGVMMFHHQQSLFFWYPLVSALVARRTSPQRYHRGDTALPSKSVGLALPFALALALALTQSLRTRSSVSRPIKLYHRNRASHVEEVACAVPATTTPISLAMSHKTCSKRH